MSGDLQFDIDQLDVEGVPEGPDPRDLKIAPVDVSKYKDTPGFAACSPVVGGLHVRTYRVDHGTPEYLTLLTEQAETKPFFALYGHKSDSLQQAMKYHFALIDHVRKMIDAPDAPGQEGELRD